MKLHLHQELFEDAIRASSDFFRISPLYIEKECMANLHGNFIHDINKLIVHDKETFNFPEGWREVPMNEIPLLNSYSELWNKLKETYTRELGALAYSPIPTSDEIYEKIMPLIIQLKNNCDITRAIKKL